jgi:2-amino-4-hydroxy-6-hydroxymethyldihydropteridine diphosphokinase
VSNLVFIALGSNLGDRMAHLAHARAALDALEESALVGASSIDETAPIGPVEQGPYLNQMVALRTTMEPLMLLERLHAIERVEGRVRGERWGPRTLDLDIVLIEGRHIDEPNLVVPHPELPNRDFWQRELADVRAQLKTRPGAVT